MVRMRALGHPKVLTGRRDLGVFTYKIEQICRVFHPLDKSLRQKAQFLTENLSGRMVTTTPGTATSP